MAVLYAIKIGRLKPVSECICKECGNSAQEYHHESYAREHRLVVIPVCQSCHRKIHYKVEAFVPPQKVC